MSKPLFQNAGQDLKTISKGIYFRTIIGYVVVALALFVCGCIYLDSGETFGWLGLILGVAAVIYGHFVAKLAVIKLYAFGELVDRVISIEGSISRKTGKGVNKEKPKVMPVPVKIDTPATKRDADGSWACPFCDHINPPGADWCEECGVEAKFE